MSDVVLGSARSSFNSPQMGDQSGKEVSTQAFYTPEAGYWLGFELKDSSKRLDLAQKMIDACNNNNFGYSQGYRENGMAQYNRYGSIKAVATPTAVDCSSLVRLCLYAIGIKLGNFNTASEPNVLRRSGLFIEKIVRRAEDCSTGMILVTPQKGHTMIVVSALQQAPNKNAQPQTNLKSVEEVANEVIKGLWGNGNARKSKLTKAGYNYEEVRQCVNAKLKRKK